MKKIVVFFFVVLMCTQGCAMRKDLMVLEGRMAQLEMQISESDKQVSRLNTQLETAVKNRDEAMSDARGNYAGVRSQMDEIREDFNRLSGQVEELRHVLKQSAGGGTQLEDRFNRLDRTITQNTDRIVRIETQLGLEAPKAGQPQPPEKTSGEEAETPSVPMPIAEKAPATEKGNYDSAKQTYDAGKWGAARQGFQKFLKTYPKSPYADSAQFWIAETYFQEKWYEKAILEYHEVIKNFPNGNKAPSAMLKQGLAFQQIGDKQNAKLVLQELIRKFPKSNEAALAKQKLQ